MKIYKSDSTISLNLRFADGGKRHISFMPKTTGGSVFYSNDEQEQQALEAHSNFGNLFFLDREVKDEELQPNSKDTSSSSPVESKQSTGLEIKVSDLAAARDYLSDKFGISRTKMRSERAILEVAKANGITFIGL